MYRRYIAVGFFSFLLIGAYFVFFDVKTTKNDYEKYYNKLVEREEFLDYLDDVNISIEEIEQENSKYTYIVTFGGVTSKKENIKILILDEHCNKDKVEIFPSVGIISDKGYSLVKQGNQDKDNNLYEYGVLTVADEEKIDNFIIYFSSKGVEQFAKIAVNRD